MKYVYESHMGGIYLSDDYLSVEETYCDQCGDYDYLLGQGETLEELWNVLKEHTALFDIRKCDNCPHREDYDYCNENCEEYAKSGGYTVSHVMEVLHEAFPDDKKWNYIYMVANKRDDDNLVLVRCNHSGFDFCERHSLPCTVCCDSEYIDICALQLICYLNEPYEESFKGILKENINGKNVCIYQCIDRELSKGDEERAQWQGENWYGYIRKENLCPLEEQQMIFEKI